MKNDDISMWDDPAESAQVRELLQAGRSAQPGYDVAKGLSRHLSLVAAGAPAPDWAQQASTGATAMKLAAWVALPVVTAAVGAAVWLGSEAAPAPTPAPRRAPAALSPAAMPPAVAEENAASRAGLARPSVGPTAAVAAASAPSASRARVAERSPLAPRGGASPAPVRGAAPAQPRTTPSVEQLMATPATPRVEPTPAAAQAPEPEAARTAREASRPAPIDDTRLEREMQMLAVAQRVLRDNPERALRMARQGEQEFGDSMLSAERQQVALLALVKLGRIDEARRLGKPFLSRYPNAPFSDRLRRALATGHLE